MVEAPEDPAPEHARWRRRGRLRRAAVALAALVTALAVAAGLGIGFWGGATTAAPGSPSQPRPVRAFAGTLSFTKALDAPLQPGEARQFTVLARTGNGAPAAGVLVHWSATGGAVVPITSVTDADGRAVTSYTAGDRPAVGTWEVRAVAEPVAASQRLDIRASTILTVPTAPSRYGGKASYSAFLSYATSNGSQPLAGQEVHFRVNGVAIGSATTNASGVATLHPEQPHGLSAGVYPVVADFAGAPAYTAATGSGTLAVSRAPQAITFAPLEPKRYGDPGFDVSAQASSGLPTHYTASGSCTVSSAGHVTITAAGSCTLTATQPGDANYDPAPAVTQALDVARAPLVVKANDASRVYGSANPAFSVSFVGFVLGQDLGVLGGQLTFETTAGPDADVGSYDVTPAGLTSKNYAISFQPGTLTVTPAPLTAAADDASRPYGAPNPAFGVRYSGFVLGQGPSVLAGKLTFDTPAGPDKDVGTYPVTPGGLAARNYAITFVPGTLTVEPAPLTVSANDVSRPYGAPNPAFRPSFSGWVLGQGPAVLGGALSFATPADAHSDVGPYPIVPSGLTARNYAIRFQPGVLTVTPAPLTVTANDATRVYGDPNPAFSVRYAGFVLGQDERALGGALRFGTLAGPSSDAGTYDVLPQGLTSDNYAIRYQPGTLTITPAPLTITAIDVTKVYGQENPTFSARYAGFVLGQDERALTGPLQFSTPADAHSDVGSYPVVPSGPTSHNYAITFKAGTLNVVPAPLTVKVNDSSRPYGAPNPAFDVSYSGFVLGQDATALEGTLTFSTAAEPRSDVGSYTVEPSGLKSNNYAITYIPGTLRVFKADQAIDFAPLEPRTYGDPPIELHVRASSGLPVTFSAAGGCSVSGSQVRIESATPCTVTASQAGNSNFNPAADFTQTFPIARAVPPIIWAPPRALVYGAALSADELSATAPVPGEFTYDPPPGAVLAAGRHQVSARFMPSDVAKYAPSTASQSLEVRPATPTLTWTVPSPLYVGAPVGSPRLFASASATVASTTVPVPGTMSYAPTTLQPGRQLLRASFKPDDSQNFTAATQETEVNAIYRFDGFVPSPLRPLQAFTPGATVPIRLRLLDDAGNPVPTAVVTLVAWPKTALGRGGSVPGWEESAVESAQFHYDPSTQLYVLNFTSHLFNPSQYVFLAHLDDGTLHQFDYLSPS